MIFLPHIGLSGEFEPCEENILNYLNRNFLMIDAIMQMKAVDFVSSLPSVANVGDVYLLDDDISAYGFSKNSVIVWNGDSWIEVEPKLGFITAVASDNKIYWYNGTDWAEIPLTWGDVQGPNTSLKNSVARWDSVDGKWLTDSGVTLDDDESMSGLSSVYSDAIISERTYTRDINIDGKAAVVDVDPVTNDPTGKVILQSSFNLLNTAISEINAFERPESNPWSAIYVLENRTGQTVVIKNNSDITTGTGSDFRFKDNSTLVVAYSSQTNTFNIISGGGSASGGGGGWSNIVWRDGFIPPLKTTDQYGNYYFEMANDGFQSVVGMVRVPDSYDPGTQVVLRISGFWSPQNSTAQINCTATAQRPGLTLAGGGASYAANSGTVTNSPLFPNRFEDFIIPLTDASGKMGGGSFDLAPGDLLSFKLTRENSGTTDPINLIPYSAEVRSA